MWVSFSLLYWKPSPQTIQSFIFSGHLSTIFLLVGSSFLISTSSKFLSDSFSESSSSSWFLNSSNVKLCSLSISIVSFPLSFSVSVSSSIAFSSIFLMTPVLWSKSLSSRTLSSLLFSWMFFMCFFFLFMYSNIFSQTSHLYIFTRIFPWSSKSSFLSCSSLLWQDNMWVSFSLLYWKPSPQTIQSFIFSGHLSTIFLLVGSSFLISTSSKFLSDSFSESSSSSWLLNSTKVKLCSLSISIVSFPLSFSVSSSIAFFSIFLMIPVLWSKLLSSISSSSLLFIYSSGCSIKPYIKLR